MLDVRAAPQQIPMDFSVRPALGRADFLIGASNQDAVSWIDLWPNWPAPMLILNGPAASGKTHLAAVWQDQSQAVVVKPDSLMNASAEEIVSQGEHLVIDGIDPWLGDRTAETTLFHIYNILKEEGRSALLNMRMAPAQTEFAIADLASRLRAAPVATIHAPDDMLLGSVLIKLFSDRQLRIGNDVLKYVLPRMERSFSAAQGVASRADKMALAQKRPISIPLMRDVLHTLQEEELSY